MLLVEHKSGGLLKQFIQYHLRSIWSYCWKCLFYSTTHAASLPLPYQPKSCAPHLWQFSIVQRNPNEVHLSNKNPKLGILGTHENIYTFESVGSVFRQCLWTTTQPPSHEWVNYAVGSLGCVPQSWLPLSGALHVSYSSLFLLAHLLLKLSLQHM